MPINNKPKRLYNTRRWQRLRKLFLQTNPLCVFCTAKGKVTAANIVDHVIPHKGDEVKFWNQNNWQALCKSCHDSDKKIMEAGGYLGCDVHGNLITSPPNNRASFPP